MDQDHYAGIAEYLADRFMAVRATKTADSKSASLWQSLRPENPDRPGANWMTGLGTGALAAGVETGAGRHGLTESGIRFLDRLDLQSNPGRIFKDKELMQGLADDDRTKFLKKLLAGPDKKRIGALLARNYGSSGTTDPAEMKRLYGELRRLTGGKNTEMGKRFSDLTRKAHSSNSENAQRIFDALDRHLARVRANPKSPSSPLAINQLTKFRNSFGNVESADDLVKLKKGLQNLSASVKSGKKGAPAPFVFSGGTRKLLDVLGSAPVETKTVRDPGKIKDLVASLGQFTKGRHAPSILTRFRRGSLAAGAGTVLGAYGLPSLIDLARSFRSGNTSNPPQP